MVIRIIASEKLKNEETKIEKEANDMSRENWSVYAIAELIAEKYCCAVSTKHIEKDKYLLSCFKGF